MSNWTRIHGYINTVALGRNQAESEYILKTVLLHLPKVYNHDNYVTSERIFETYVHEINYPGGFRSTDEFGNRSNLGRDSRGYKSGTWFVTPTGFVIGLYGLYRNADKTPVFQSFVQWLCRFSKRVMLSDLYVKIEDDNSISTISDVTPYHNMYDFENNWVQKMLR